LNDLEKVLQHVERRRREAEEEQRCAKEELAQMEIAEDWRRSNLIKLEIRLRDFARDVRGKARIYFSVNNYRIRISISTTHPLLRRPFRTIDVFPDSDAQNFNVYVSGIEESEPEVSDLGENEHEPGPVQSFDQLVDVVAKEVAVFIETNGEFPFELPAWYVAVGKVMGWIFFVAILLLSTMTFGFWGFIIGGVGGALAMVAGRKFWLPILVAVGLAITGH
jgi:hypothetical protein